VRYSNLDSILADGHDTVQARPQRASAQGSSVPLADTSRARMRHAETSPTPPDAN